MTRPRVLIVEDEEDLVELLVYKLAQEGFEPVACRRGDVAVEAARARRPDIVLLDLMLPGLDGLEVCRLLRRDPATASIPVVMLTARAEEVDRIVGLELGADDYIVKPFSPREVALRLKAVLRRTRGPREPGERLELGGLTLDLAAPGSAFARGPRPTSRRAWSRPTPSLPTALSSPVSSSRASSIASGSPPSTCRTTSMPRPSATRPLAATTLRPGIS